MSKQRRENIQINETRDEKGDIATTTNEIHRIIRELAICVWEFIHFIQTHIINQN
jgi:hypothetical protein